jgi:hypothetical protein
MLLVFGLFAETAFGASDRRAVVTEASGHATVKKAGGALDIRIYPGMPIGEGDFISVGPGGHLVLRTDRGDEITLGENWRGTLSRLREDVDGGTGTAVRTWAGATYSHVAKREAPSGSYRVELPTAVLEAKGTHFMVTIDKVTGEVRMIVTAGIVAKDDRTYLPSNQLTVYPWRENEDAPPAEILDPDEIAVALPDHVLEALLRNLHLIESENQELLEQLRGSEETGELIERLGNLGGLRNLQDESLFERYKANVENMLFLLLKSAHVNGKLDWEIAQEILRSVNEMIEEENRKFDLENEVPPLDRTVGIDPEEEERRRAAREEAERQREQRAREKEDKREAVKQQAPDIADRLEARNREQEEANRRAEEEKQNQALDKHMQQLHDEQRQELEERLQQRKAEKERMDRGRTAPMPGEGAEEEAAPPPPPSPTPPPQPSPDPSDTITEINLSVTDAVYGQPFSITAVVKTPDGSPVPDGGTVAFTIGPVTVGSAATLEGAATFVIDGDKWALLAENGVGFGAHTLTASYAGVPQQYDGSSAAREMVLLPSGPVVLIWKELVEDSPNSFEVRIEFAHFTGDAAIREADIRFMHYLSLGDWDNPPDFLASEEYNDAFGGDSDFAHQFGHIEYALPEGGQDWLARYEFLAFGDAAAEIAGRDFLAKIRFDLQAWAGKTPGDVAIDVVSVHVLDRNGEPIGATVVAGPGVQLALSDDSENGELP